ncbi:unnamed protein product [Paramecium sonneborni]|uniref:MORN repeat protein n=1 Tax=Paramecium sonneborni TaxID=65129 RepID=A0A8S1KS44_9CILI|nr:unnamed protein product [Paramecium sonneborni]
MGNRQSQDEEIDDNRFNAIQRGLQKIQSGFQVFRNQQDEKKMKKLDEIDRPKNATLCPEFYDMIAEDYRIQFDKKTVKKKFKRYPPFRLENGDIYEGCWIHGKKHGLGILLLQNGTIIQGEWQNDALLDGRIIYPNGDIQVGNQYTYANGIIFIGDDDYGIEKHPDGSIYTGEFHNGHKHGRGQFIYSDGSVYTGDFVEDLYSGYGELKYYNKIVYEGQWFNGQMHGLGTLKWPDKREYEGEFKYGLKNGPGKMKYSDKSEFHGIFENGLKFGKGRWIDSHQQLQEREIENGHMLDPQLKPPPAQQSQND